MILADNEETRGRAIELIASGGVLAFRTDTFYGLGADPFKASGVKRIKELKGRDDNKPILLLIADLIDLDRVIPERSAIFDRLAEDFWPGALTIIGVADPRLPRDITAGTNTVGVRLPNDLKVRELVRACGGLLTATSANPSSAAPARSAQEVADYFDDALEMIIDGGLVRATRPSTVVDATGAVPVVVREGVISEEQLRQKL